MPEPIYVKATKVLITESVLVTPPASSTKFRMYGGLADAVSAMSSSFSSSRFPKSVASAASSFVDSSYMSSSSSTARPSGAAAAFSYSTTTIQHASDRLSDLVKALYTSNMSALMISLILFFVLSILGSWLASCYYYQKKRDPHPGDFLNNDKNGRGISPSHLKFRGKEQSPLLLGWNFPSFFNRVEEVSPITVCHADIVHDHRIPASRPGPSTRGGSDAKPNFRSDAPSPESSRNEGRRDNSSRRRGTGRDSAGPRYSLISSLLSDDSSSSDDSTYPNDSTSSDGSTSSNDSTSSDDSTTVKSEESSSPDIADYPTSPPFNPPRRRRTGRGSAAPSYSLISFSDESTAVKREESSSPNIADYPTSPVQNPLSDTPTSSDSSSSGSANDSNSNKENEPPHTSTSQEGTEPPHPSTSQEATEPPRTNTPRSGTEPFDPAVHERWLRHSRFLLQQVENEAENQNPNRSHPPPLPPPHNAVQEWLNGPTPPEGVSVDESQDGPNPRRLGRLLEPYAEEEEEEDEEEEEEEEEEDDEDEEEEEEVQPQPGPPVVLMVNPLRRGAPRAGRRAPERFAESEYSIWRRRQR